MKSSSLLIAVTICALAVEFSVCQETAESGFRLGEALTVNEKKASTGPWGTLEFYQLVLEPSDFLLSFSTDLRSWREGTIWRFGALNSEGVNGILEKAGVSPALRKILLSDQYMTLNAETGLYEIRPPENVITALNSENRRLLYPEILPHNEDNPFFENYAMPVGGLKAVTYVPSGVPQEQLDLISRLSFKKGNTLRFADIQLVLAKAQSEAERWRILKTISRERTLSVQLRVTQESDLAQLESYWSAGGKNREILPILESVGLTAGIETLDIIHLLPPTPRKLLNTYPSPQGDGIGKELPDCYWTAASFFSENPPTRHFDSIAQVIHNRYEKATKPLLLGDLILLDDEESGKPIHACNYLAGNLVYTKNGRSLGRPWVISTFEDVVEEYLTVERMSVSFARLKPEFRN